MRDPTYVVCMLVIVFMRYLLPLALFEGKEEGDVFGYVCT